MYSLTIPRAVAALGTAAALALPAAAQAHVTIQPSTAEAGGFTRIDVRVPNERADAGTTKVQVQLPPGFAFASYEPRPGWTVETDDGTITEGIGEITWTGHGKQGMIAPGQFMDFGLSVKMPDGEPGQKLTFKALQTYNDGREGRQRAHEGVRLEGAGPHRRPLRCDRRDAVLGADAVLDACRWARSSRSPRS